MTNLVFKATLDTGPLTQQLQGVTKQVQTVTEKMNRVASAAKAAFAAVATGVVGQAIKRQIDYADALGETAEKLNISTEALSEYRYAAELSGVSTEALQSGLSRLNRQIVDNSDKFAELGINVKNADGSFRDSTDVMGELAEVISQMPDGAEKAALAMEFFGRSGAELIPLLNRGKEGIAALADEARSMGLVITQDQADAAGAFNDSLDKINKTIQGVTIAAFAALSPYIQQVADFVLNAAQAFNKLDDDTKTMIITIGALATAVGLATTAFKLLFAGMGPVGWVILGIGVAISALIVYWDDIKAVMTSLYEWITSTFIGVWESLRETLTNWGTAIQESIGAAFEWLTTTLQNFYNKILEVVAAIPPAWETVKESVGSLKDWFVAKFQEIVDYLAGLPELMIEMGGNIIQGLWDGLAAKFDAMGEWFNAKVDQFITDAKSILGIQSPSTVFEGMGRNIVEGLNIGLASTPITFQEKLQEFIENSKTSVDDMAGIFTNAFGGMEDALVSFVKTGELDFSKMIDSMIEDMIRFSIRSMMYGGPGGGGGLLGGLGKGASAVAGGGGKLFSRNGNAFGSSGQLNFANGGVFNQKFAMPMGDGRLAIGAEAGPEAIMPLQRGSDGKLGVVANTMGNGGGQTVVNNFNTTINPGNQTSPQDARKFAAEFNRAVEQKVMETMAKRQNVGVGGRR